MGLHNEITQTGRGTSLSIVGGKWTIRVPEGTPGAESRKLTKGANMGQTIWELRYPSLSGYLISGCLEENEHIGLIAKMILRDDEDESRMFEVDFSAKSQYLKELIKRLPNLNPTEPIRLELAYNAKKKTKTGGDTYNFHVVQGGRMVKDYYCEWKKNEKGENVCTYLHGMPEAIKSRAGWNFADQDEFLLMKFEEFFGGLTETVMDIQDESQVNAPSLPADDDQIPF